MLFLDIAGYIPSATPSGSTTPTPSGSESVSEKAGYLLYSGQAAALGGWYNLIKRYGGFDFRVEIKHKSVEKTHYIYKLMLSALQREFFTVKIKF